MTQATTSLEHELIALLRREFEAPHELGLDSSYDEMALDSLTLVELAVMLSNRYEIEITDGEMSEGGTVRARSTY